MRSIDHGTVLLVLGWSALLLLLGSGAAALLGYYFSAALGVVFALVVAAMVGGALRDLLRTRKARIERLDARVRSLEGRGSESAEPADD